MIVYVDMDGVLVDFQSGIDQLDDETKAKYHERYDEVPGIFGLMKHLTPVSVPIYSVPGTVTNLHLV